MQAAARYIAGVSFNPPVSTACNFSATSAWK